MQLRGASASSLAQIVRNRRWQCCTRPFPHFIARDVFTPGFYGELDAAYGDLMARGLSEDHDPTRFSRNIRNYDAYSMLFHWDLPDPFKVFLSREWHDMLANLAKIPATGDITGGFHHHLNGSRSGQIHNDLNPGWFVDSPYPGSVNLSQDSLCEYSTGQVHGEGYSVHESVRALAVLFYLHNPPWQSSDGGETGLYDDASQAVDRPTKAVPPLNNTLFAFECRANSFHSFMQNRNGPRNSVIMWLHRPKSDVLQRWGHNAIVEWGGKPRASQNELREKVVLFTGAGGNLGEMFCRMFGAQYDIVAVLGRSLPGIVTQHQWWIDPLNPDVPLAENRSQVYAIQADLTEEAERRRVVEVALARFDRIDMVVNAAAVCTWAPMLNNNELLENAPQHFETNVLLPLRLSSLIADYFWRDRTTENRSYNRSVVNISSTSGVYVYPGVGQSIYSASKAALNYLTMHMADEFGNLGVRVNALAPTSFPGLIPTEAASEGIRRLAESDANGRILILDVNGERWV